MAETHPEPGHAEHGHTEHGHADAAHGAHDNGHISDKTFMKVFGALLVATGISFGVNQLIGAGNPAVNFIIIGIVAVCKALLVTVYFMHLIIDWKKLFFFIVPVMILAPLIVIVLWPDMVHAWRTMASP